MDSDDQQNRLHLNHRHNAGTDDQQNRLHLNNRHNAGNPNVCHSSGGDSVNDTNTTMLRNLTDRHHVSDSTNHTLLSRNFHEHSTTGTRLTPFIAHNQGNIAQHIATNRSHLSGTSQARYTPTGDTSSDDDVIAQYLLLNSIAEQIPTNRQQVLSSQQIAFLQIEEMRLNLPSLFINQPAFPPLYDATIHLYQQHHLINSALQQLNQANTTLSGMASIQRQSGHIPVAVTSPFSNARHIWVDPSAAIAHFQHNDVVQNRQHSNERAVVMSTPLQSSTSAHFPLCIAHSDDEYNLSSHQQYLRLQIEAFQADEEDVLTYVRGRNRPIQVGQIGIRCRHCAHVRVAQREKGSTYYPANIMGIYQAAQNMSTTHIQCGRCPSMPTSVKENFKSLIATKSSSNGAGRSYWADKIREDMNLIDTEHGIFPALYKVSKFARS